jgi:hypothetical protein
MKKNFSKILQNPENWANIQLLDAQSGCDQSQLPAA